ncbi:hypothetical protein BLNAU_18035 [Blattamonas nauphoetae]|uniref:Uncharacterized protein n=1 Tax=Blattamonas nauphoetae TaxID=2049346 RepID=A0ABQ9X5I6_9EUKA|nr:hypothetical protein BLNAU_18035 [Blattamonas nauphoetae]
MGASESRKQIQKKIKHLEKELAQIKANLKKQDEGVDIKIGSTAIERYTGKEWTVYEFVFRKADSNFATLLSFEFGAVVSRLSLNIQKGPTDTFAVGLISSSQSNEALKIYFPVLVGTAAWELFADGRWAIQSGSHTHQGSACEAGKKGQRIVLEADGREGKRTLKLSQDGKTQPVYFTNIPVPFRFAVFIDHFDDAVEIESAEVVEKPLLSGGKIPVEMEL